MNGDIILKQSISDNPLYVYMDESFKCLIYVLIHNISLVKASDFSASIIHAGEVYNNLFISNQGIADEDLKKLAIDFKFQTETNTKLKGYVLEDPLQNMFQFCRFFFIPVRLDVSTLKEQLKYNSLKTFISTIVNVEFNAIFLSKYTNVINNIPVLQRIIDMINNDKSMVEKIEKLQEKYVLDSLGNMFNSKNTTQIFIRTFGMILIQICIEVIKRYNPVIQECVKINPNYNGEWVNPFDPIFNEQIADIRKFDKFCGT